MTEVKHTKSDQIAPDLMRPGATRRRRLSGVAALITAAAIGAGATAIAQKGRTVTYVALSPAPISAMRDSSPIAIEGEIAEVFGNKFVVQDSGGRALVETGRQGEDRNLVAKDERVTVQGRFDHGFVHATAIRHADGRTDSLDSPPPPPPGFRPKAPL